MVKQFTINNILIRLEQHIKQLNCANYQAECIRIDELFDIVICNSLKNQAFSEFHRLKWLYYETIASIHQSEYSELMQQAIFSKNQYKQCREEDEK